MTQLILNLPLALLATAWATQLKHSIRPDAPGAALMQRHQSGAEAMAWTHGLMVLSSGIALPASIYVITTVMALTYWIGEFWPMAKRIHQRYTENHTA